MDYLGDILGIALTFYVFLVIGVAEFLRKARALNNEFVNSFSTGFTAIISLVFSALFFMLF